MISWSLAGCTDVSGVVSVLREANADIMLLQSVDLGCARTQFDYLPILIAHALHANMFFVCEFTEIQSDERGPGNQGGGVVGHAILTRFDFNATRVHVHAHQPFDWTTQGASVGEPRIGRRVCAVADVASPIGAITCYSVQLETYCGMGCTSILVLTHRAHFPLQGKRTA